MPRCFEPRFDVLPAAQREIWPQLKPAAGLSFVLYGGTGVALCFGHRVSLDFDFFRAEPLDKDRLRSAFAFLSDVRVLQDSVNTLAVSVMTGSGAVKLSFFGGIGFGRVNEPLQTTDGVLLVASMDDLMATKLKAILDRAEARDYRDIAAMLRHGAALERGLGAFRAMFKGEPATVLRALGWFEDGDLPSLNEAERGVLTAARDRVGDVPSVEIASGSLAVATGQCDEIVIMRPTPPRR
jgi:Nucleotidyl transferase AbiEii toxin, Type IV TA system